MILIKDNISQFLIEMKDRSLEIIKDQGMQVIQDYNSLIKVKMGNNTNKDSHLLDKEYQISLSQLD